MKKIWVLVLVVIMNMAVMAGCSSAGSIKVDMEQYISVSYTGCNGSGTATFDFDYADFEYEIMSQWKDEDNKLDKLAELTALEMTINCDPATVDGLSNGDTVTVTMTCNEEKAKELGCSFTGMRKTFTVEGLKDAIMIDPFDESIFGPEKTVGAELCDIAPWAWLSIYNSAGYSDPISGIKYEAENWENLKNGDVVTVTAALSDNWARQGYVLSRTETTITVEGLDTCVTDASQLTDDFLQSLADIAYDRCVADDIVDLLDGSNTMWLLGSEFENIHVGDMAYLMVGKEHEEIANYMFVPVYKTFIFSDWDGDQPITRVFEDTVSYYVFREIVFSADGELSYYTDDVGANAFYTSDEIANEMLLEDYRLYYNFIEIPML